MRDPPLAAVSCAQVLVGGLANRLETSVDDVVARVEPRPGDLPVLKIGRPSASRPTGRSR